MSELLDQPITTIAKAVKNGETTAVALAEAALARIEAVNPALNAVVALNPELPAPSIRLVEKHHPNLLGVVLALRRFWVLMLK